MKHQVLQKNYLYCIVITNAELFSSQAHFLVYIVINFVVIKIHWRGTELSLYL
jgi:hypothetical protein